MKTRLLNVVCFIAILVLFASCKSSVRLVNGQYYTISGYTQGTTYSIIYRDTLSRTDEIEAEIHDLLLQLDTAFSIYNPQSLLSRLNRGENLPLSDSFIECFNATKEISIKTEGLLDPTLKPFITAYGFGESEAAEHVSQRDIDSLLQFVGYDKVSIVDGRLTKERESIQLDYNATAKGYSVDVIGRFLEDCGIDDYLVEIGGEVRCKGVNRAGEIWRIAIDTPFEGNFIPGISIEAVVSLNDHALATSGNYRKFRLDSEGKRVVHTIDPRTGKPSIHSLLSATVIAPNCIEADGFATACMVGGLDVAKRMIESDPHLAALFMYEDNMGEIQIYLTPSMSQFISEKSSKR